MGNKGNKCNNKGKAWIWSPGVDTSTVIEDLPSENCKNQGLWIYTRPDADPKDPTLGIDLDNLNLEGTGKFVRITATKLEDQ